MKRLLIGLLTCLLFSVSAGAVEQRPVTVVFVCQYGYAKSLVATRHFERKAAAYGLPVKVLARGLTPAPTVAPAIVTALASDGFDVATYQPMALTEVETSTSDRLIGFAVDLPDPRGISVRIDDVPPLSEDYGKARDRINEVLDALLLDLLAERARTP